MSTYPIYLRPELAPIIAETPEQTTWDLPAMRKAGDALLANPHEAINRVEVTARGRTFIPADLAEDAPLVISIHGGGYVAGHAFRCDHRLSGVPPRTRVSLPDPRRRLHFHACRGP